MKKTKKLFSIFSSTFFCLIILFSTTHLLAQEDGPIFQDGDGIEIGGLVKKKLVKCDKTTNLIGDVSAFCSRPGMDETAAAEAYMGHVERVIASKISCVVDCPDGEGCSTYFKKWNHSYTPPAPQYGVAGCAGAYFPETYLQMTAGCSACMETPSFNGTGNNFDLMDGSADNNRGKLIETLSLFPNPATDDVTLEIRVKETLTKPQLTVYDLAGKALITETLESMEEGIYNLQIEVATLEAGIYLITLLDDTLPIETTKLVINR